MAAGKENDTQRQFFIAQIETTKQIIKKFSNTEEFSPTMLINSLLSLVVLPFECAKKTDGSKIFPGRFADLVKKIGITPQIFVPIKNCVDGDVSYNNKTIYAFVNKFRNGIAHQNLEVSVDEQRHVNIIITNKFSCKNCNKCKEKRCLEKGVEKHGNSIIDFRISVTVNELQKVALYIADAYLKAIS